MNFSRRLGEVLSLIKSPNKVCIEDKSEDPGLKKPDFVLDIATEFFYNNIILKIKITIKVSII